VVAGRAVVMGEDMVVVVAAAWAAPTAAVMVAAEVAVLREERVEKRVAGVAFEEARVARGEEMVVDVVSEAD